MLWRMPAITMATPRVRAAPSPRVRGGVVHTDVGRSSRLAPAPTISHPPRQVSQEHRGGRHGDADARVLSPAGRGAGMTSVAAESDTLQRLAEEAVALAEERQRVILGIAGSPGAGKSTLVEQLLARIGERKEP